MTTNQIKKGKSKLLMKWRTKRLMKAVAKGKWKCFLDHQQREAWAEYCNRRVLIPHCDKCVMRLTMNAESEPQKWYLWLVYKICENGGNPHLHLEHIYTPSNSTSRFTLPDDIVGELYFEA